MNNYVNNKITWIVFQNPFAMETRVVNSTYMSHLAYLSTMFMSGNVISAYANIYDSYLINEVSRAIGKIG